MADIVPIKPDPKIAHLGKDTVFHCSAHGHTNHVMSSLGTGMFCIACNQDRARMLAAKIHTVDPS